MAKNLGDLSVSFKASKNGFCLLGNSQQGRDAIIKKITLTRMSNLTTP